jgi:hypothetical protein
LLAADCGLYYVKDTHHLNHGYIETPTRPRRAVVRLLRKLRKSRKRPDQSVAVNTRLLFINSGVATGKKNGISRPPRAGAPIATTPLTDLDKRALEMLLEYRGAPDA